MSVKFGKLSTKKSTKIKLWTVDCRLWTIKGFSLIEVLVVLVIMGFFVAMAAQVFFKEDDQRRFDETRIRMGEIRRAILGREGAFALGQRQFSGFATDIGGLPVLVDGQPVGLWYRGTLPVWVYQATSRTWMGWRGPYLETPPRGDNILRDGWGNPFVFDDITTPDDLIITSRGADGALGGTEFNEDISLIIRRTEYMAPLAGRVRVGTGTINIRIYYPVAGAETYHTISGLSDGDHFRFESTAPAPGDIDVPVGLRSIALSRDGGATWSTDYIFTVEPTANWLGDIE